jgi:predicted ArsR family transcriptional regulator
LLLCARSQQFVVPAIWRAIDQVGGRELTRKVLKRVAHTIVDRYRGRVTGRSPRERLHQLAELWSEEGHLVELREDNKGHLLLRKRSCGFVQMYEETRTICSIDLDVIAALVQAPVLRVECRHDDSPCCAFELCSASGKS